MHVLRTNFNGDPNLGLWGLSTDSFSIVGKNVNEDISKVLKVPVIKATITNTNLIGIFAAANKSGLIVPKIIEEREIKFLRERLKINILVAKTRETCIGNLILANNKGCVIAKQLKPIKKQISDCLGVSVEIGTVAGLNIVGSAALATDEGLLVHRNCSEEELKNLEDILKVKGDIGTANFGSPFIGSCIIANSNGVVISEQTTGPEIQRINEVLGFI